MGVTRTVLEYGNGDQPKKGDEIIVEYTGFLYDEVMQCRGQWWVSVGHPQRRKLPTPHVPNSFDSSENRGCHFKTPIGVGKVIQGPLYHRRHKTQPWERSILTYSEGWDEGIMEMKLGERSILKISRYDLLRFETWDLLYEKCQMLIRMGQWLCLWTTVSHAGINILQNPLPLHHI